MTLGQYATSAESLAGASTTSGTYVNKFTLNTPSVPAGDYLVSVEFHYMNPSGGEDIQVEIVEDGTTQVYETGRLHEVPAIFVVSSVRFCLKRTLAAGTHSYALNFRRVDGSAAVEIESCRAQFFRLDASYQEAIADAPTSAGSITYTNKVTLNTGPIQAGVYRVGFTTEYQNEVVSPIGGCYVRFQRRQDPAGVNTITIMLGDNKDGVLELAVNNQGASIAATAPWQYLSWWASCLELAADTYEFELAYREEIGGNEVRMQKARIYLYRVL